MPSFTGCGASSHADLFWRSGETYLTQPFESSFSSTATGTLAATAPIPVRFWLMLRANFFTCPGGVPGDNWMITLTVPSGFTLKLSRSGAALGPYLPLPGAAIAVLKNISSIAATRCKRQDLAAAPFVVVCGFIEFCFPTPCKNL